MDVSVAAYLTQYPQAVHFSTQDVWFWRFWPTVLASLAVFP
jgi:hypothetical protein